VPEEDPRVDKGAYLTAERADMARCQSNLRPKTLAPSRGVDTHLQLLDRTRVVKIVVLSVER
jgi:hypothetical protein